LKDKGINFFKQGNYQASVNAFSEAIEIEPNNISCLSNRSACFLKLNDNISCIRDCTTALTWLEKEQEEAGKQTTTESSSGINERLKQKVKLLARRVLFGLKE
jgi:tetratricopeptide (TPR) repeat protein